MHVSPFAWVDAIYIYTYNSLGITDGWPWMVLAALLYICADNSPVTSEFPSKRPVAWRFDVFFDLRLNTRLSKQPWGWWFDKPSRPLWRHCNDYFPYSDPDVGLADLSKNTQIPSYSGIHSWYLGSEQNNKILQTAFPQKLSWDKMLVVWYSFYWIKWPSWRLELSANRVFVHTDQPVTSRSALLFLCEGGPPVSGEFPAQRDIYAKRFPFNDIIR